MTKMTVKQKEIFDEKVKDAFEEKMEPFKTLLHLKDAEEQQKAEAIDTQRFMATLVLVGVDHDFDFDSPDKLGHETEEGKKAHEKQYQLFQLAAAKLDGKINANGLFDTRIEQAAKMFLISEGEFEDVEAFKKACTHAIDTYALAFRAHGTSELVDQVKAVGMAVLGVLVTLITSPAFLVPQSIHDHGLWIKSFNFFAGPETDKSREVQKEMDDAFVSSCLPAA